MILLVSGEGPTDIGRCDEGAEVCSGADFIAGPMAVLIDKLAETEWRFSPMDIGAMEFVAEHALSARSREIKPLPKQAVLPGLKGARETGMYFTNARALAHMAKERADTDKCPVGAVLFRDSDGTNLADASQREQKLSSIMRGFAAEEFEYGVAMVPKPKSEAWLMCALQPAPYDHCERFEALPGNDASPHSAKAQFQVMLTAREKDLADLADLAKDGTISATRIVMPSYDEFRNRILEVARKMQSA